jgi:ribonucleoside-triphosphate reductase
MEGRYSMSSLNDFTQLSNPDYSRYIHVSRYARWRDDLGRRENWGETVSRYCDFWKQRYPDIFPYEEIYNAIYNLDIVPSMRSLMTAGPALERDNIAGFNCSYIPIIDARCFSEVMFILMNGTGVGYSVERQYVAKLPEVAEEFHPTETTISVADSKAGWAAAFQQLISLLYQGQIPRWDTTRVRPAGAKLKTFGGRASGPGPLVDLFQFTVSLFQKAAGRRLTSVECSDLVCKTAEVVVVGGVRRSALICLSNLSDERMRNYKNGQWWVDDGQRALANISAAYTEKPDIGTFMKEWTALYESKSGERGIFNRVSARKQAESTGRRDSTYEFGTNPCGEIILRPFGFCNLSEVIVRANDSFESLKRKVQLATIIGTFQSTLTDFKYIRKQWKTNAEEERLLGVSLTGIMDHALLSGGQEAYEPSDYGDFSKGSVLENVLKELREATIETNKEWAGRLNIEQSTSITTIKPSGTVSQLVDSASGIHPRYAPYYVRTVRADVKDPLAIFLKDQGVPCEPDVTNSSNLVFSFPISAPTGSITRNERSAIQTLEHYLIFKRYWCEHNPSITVYVKEHEWLDVGAWVYQHLDDVGGVSFLPHSDHIYRQAPYQDIDSVTYTKLAESFPTIDWEAFYQYEKEDMTTSSHELACKGGVCEL